MYQDAFLQFSAAQAVTAAAASTNVIDWGTARDMGTGDNLEIDIRVNVAAAAAGAATVQFQYQTADDAGFTTNVQTVVQTDAIPKASLVAGATIPLHVDRSAPYAARRYGRLNYNVGTGPLTAGTFTAGIVKTLQDPQTSYASGFAVL
ncbi:Bbp16 family capsid cement protein [Cupriavidus sp. CuC1]|uniref:Bbp16 family capsid cement protein n=1 Tax=Cupriavidus sp. CuC1 TaxID=3373131 RepID=UPI0037CFD268